MDAEHQEETVAIAKVGTAAVMKERKEVHLASLLLRFVVALAVAEVLLRLECRHCHIYQHAATTQEVPMTTILSLEAPAIQMK